MNDDDNDSVTLTLTKDQARIALAALERRFESLARHGVAACPPAAQEVWDTYQAIDKQIQWEAAR
jgi:hypothetical protein